jgi:hypothetical protein
MFKDPEESQAVTATVAAAFMHAIIAGTHNRLVVPSDIDAQIIAEAGFKYAAAWAAHAAALAIPVPPPPTG